jgi:hypothetical protein
VSKPKICFKSLQNASGSARVSGRYFSLALAPETSRDGCPVEPHRAFAAQGDDAAPDQNIGTGLLEEAPRFLFGFFLLCLLSARGRPFHDAVNG